MCRQCGFPLPSDRHGKLYCSSACCDRWRYLNKVKPGKYGEQTCAECGTSFMRSSQQRKYCSPACFDAARRKRYPGSSSSERTHGAASCPHCSQEYLRRSTLQVYCSESCKTKAHHARRMTDGSYEVQRERIRRPEYGTPCAECGKRLKRFWAEVPRCKSCGIAAKQREAQAAARRRRIAAKLAVAAAGTAGRFPFASGCCLACGAWFVHHQFGGPSTCYCSRACRGMGTSRGGAKRRKISKPARARVHHRYAWTCQICGDPVDRNAEIGDPGYPVIDHRIPLAAGGADDEGNWQTAHWYCNSVKCDQVGFEFWTPEEVAA